MTKTSSPSALARSAGALVGIVIGIYSVFIFHNAIYGAGIGYRFRYLLEPLMIVVFLALLGWVIARFALHCNQLRKSSTSEPARNIRWFSKGVFFAGVLYALIVCVIVGLRMAFTGGEYFFTVLLLMGGVPFALSLLFLPLGSLAAKLVARLIHGPAVTGDH